MHSRTVPVCLLLVSAGLVYAQDPELQQDRVKFGTRIKHAKSQCTDLTHCKFGYVYENDGRSRGLEVELGTRPKVEGENLIQTEDFPVLPAKQSLHPTHQKGSGNKTLAVSSLDTENSEQDATRELQLFELNLEEDISTARPAKVGQSILEKPRPTTKVEKPRPTTKPVGTPINQKPTDVRKQQAAVRPHNAAVKQRQPTVRQKQVTVTQVGAAVRQKQATVTLVDEAVRQENPLSVRQQGPGTMQHQTTLKLRQTADKQKQTAVEKQQTDVKQQIAAAKQQIPPSGGLRADTETNNRGGEHKGATPRGEEDRGTIHRGEEDRGTTPRGRKDRDTTPRGAEEVSDENLQGTTSSPIDRFFGVSKAITPRQRAVTTATSATTQTTTSAETTTTAKTTIAIGTASAEKSVTTTTSLPQVLAPTTPSFSTTLDSFEHLWSAVQDHQLEIQTSENISEPGTQSTLRTLPVPHRFKGRLAEEISNRESAAVATTTKAAATVSTTTTTTAAATASTTTTAVSTASTTKRTIHQKPKPKVKQNTTTIKQRKTILDSKSSKMKSTAAATTTTTTTTTTTQSTIAITTAATTSPTISTTLTTSDISEALESDNSLDSSNVEEVTIAVLECPGGSLEICVNACAEIDDVYVYSLCVINCGRRCSG